MKVSATRAKVLMAERAHREHRMLSPTECRQTGFQNRTDQIAKLRSGIEELSPDQRRELIKELNKT